MILTTPNAILRDLRPDCVIALRAVPEDGRYVVVVYSTIAVESAKPPPTAPKPNPTEHRTLSLTWAIAGLSGWLAAFILWVTRQSKHKVA
jgi:hypothetical protein